MSFWKVNIFVLCCIVSSCNSLDFKNKQSFSDIASIIVVEEGEKYIKNSYSIFSSLSLDTIPEGTCGLASYFVDYDNQLSDKLPFNAELISWNTLDVSSFQLEPEIISDEYTNTIVSIVSTTLVDQFLFLPITQRMSYDSVFDYELLCNTDSVDSREVINMYLRARLVTQGADTTKTDRNVMLTFNILPFLEQQVLQGNDSLIQFNLNYANKFDSETGLRYLSYKSNPVKILLR